MRNSPSTSSTRGTAIGSKKEHKRKEFESASFYREEADSYNSLYQRTFRIIEKIYKVIEENASIGKYTISYDFSEAIGDEQLQEEVLRVLKEKHFKVSITSSNIYDAFGPVSNRFIGVPINIMTLNISWDK